MKTQERIQITLHKYQGQVYNFKKQYGFAICGTKAGKSFIGSVWTVKKIQEYPLGTGLISAPTTKILQQATLDTFFRLFPEFRQFYKKQEGVIELPSGGRVYVRSTDEPLALEGFNLDWVWLDEIGMMNRIVWAIIKNKVAISNGQILGTTNAYYLNWLYNEVYLPWKNGKDKDIEVFSWKSVDNPYFPKEFADKEKERMSPAEYSRRYEGRFVRLEGLVWEINESHILKKTDEAEKYLAYPERVIGGVDWGFTNPAGILIIKIKDGKYYVVDEWKESQRTTVDIVQKAEEFSKEYCVQTWYPDPAEPDRIEEMRKAGLTTGEVNKNIALGISEVADLFKTHSLFILDSCSEILDEISQYRYEDPRVADKKDRKEVPMKVNDHLCDALRYAIIGNEMGQSLTYQEEKEEEQRILFNRQSKKDFELL